MQIEKYRLLDKEGYATDEIFESYEDALEEAKDRNFAVEALIFEFRDSDLVYTPDGSWSWPPSKRKE